MIKRIILATLLLAGLSGCSQPMNLDQVSPYLGQEQIQTFSPKEVIERSKAQFDSAGMTEEVFSGGDNYILTYEPGQIFVAALYNESFDDVIAIDQPEMFTVYAAHLMSQTKGVSYVETECGFEITAPDSPGMSLCVQDGLIISGSALDGSWDGNFNYSTDQDVLALIGQEQ